MLRIGIVSDTHGVVRNTELAVRMLEALEVAEVIHCGDIGSPKIVELFAKWPTHFVLGNVDQDREEDAVVSLGQVFHGRFGKLEREGKRLAFLHGDDEKRLKATIQSGDYDAVFSGHTHKMSIEKIGKTWAINPGALHRAATHTFGILDLPSLDFQHIPVDTSY